MLLRAGPVRLRGGSVRLWADRGGPVRLWAGLGRLWAGVCVCVCVCEWVVCNSVCVGGGGDDPLPVRLVPNTTGPPPPPCN